MKLTNIKDYQIRKQDYPDPVSNPTSSVMFIGDWYDHPHEIDFDRLPRIPSDHVVVSNVQNTLGKSYNFSDKYYWNQKESLRGGVNQHSYLIFHNDRYWIMWSDGPAVEDHVGQVVKYVTSKNGLNWSPPKFLTDYPPNSGPDSPHYGERSTEGFRYIARGFWKRDGKLLALVSLDEAGGFFGPSLQLIAYCWNAESEAWEQLGMVYDNAINNFPPKQLITGEWLMSRRSHDYEERGVDFMVGGTVDFNHWETYPVMGSNTKLFAEEPFWWVLPDGKNLMSLYRDNRDSGYIYRSFSIDNGRTWSQPVQTNFPNARSKFHGLRLSGGQYVLVSNPNPEKRDPLTLSISNDGVVFTKMGYLTGGRHIDYPHLLEHNGYLFVAFAGSVKQKIEVLRINISDLDSIDMSKISSN